MKPFFKILLVAVVGSACGAAARQLVNRRSGDAPGSNDLVIAASPAGIGAGLLAGLLFKRHGSGAASVAAFVAAANVAANVDPAVLAGITERFRSGGSTGT